MIATAKSRVGDEPRPPVQTLNILSKDDYERALWGLTTVAKSFFGRGPFRTIEEVIAFETELKRDAAIVLKAHREKRRKTAKKVMKNKKGYRTAEQRSAQKALDVMISSDDSVGASKRLFNYMVNTYGK